MFQEFNIWNYQIIKAEQKFFKRIKGILLYHLKLNNAADRFANYSFIKTKTMNDMMMFFIHRFRYTDKEETIINNNGITVTVKAVGQTCMLKIVRVNLRADSGTVEFNYTNTTKVLACKYDITNGSSGYRTKHTNVLSDPQSTVPIDEVTKRMIAEIFRVLGSFNEKKESKLYWKYNIY